MKNGPEDYNRLHLAATFVYLEFLLVNRKVAGLDVEKSAAAETQHVLVLGVPRHAVGIRLL